MLAFDPLGFAPLAGTNGSSNVTTVTLTAGAYAHAGQSITIDRRYNAAIIAAAIAMAGAAIILNFRRQIAVLAGSFSYTGQLVTIIGGAAGAVAAVWQRIIIAITTGI